MSANARSRMLEAVAAGRIAQRRYITTSTSAPSFYDYLWVQDGSPLASKEERRALTEMDQDGTIRVSYLNSMAGAGDALVSLGKRVPSAGRRNSLSDPLCQTCAQVMRPTRAGHQCPTCDAHAECSIAVCGFDAPQDCGLRGAP